MWYPSGHVKDQCKVNAKLIEDAPLLVEEVKRLRNKIRLLDIVEDKDGALDRILLNSGMLTGERTCTEHTVIQNWEWNSTTESIVTSNDETSTAKHAKLT